VIEGSVGNGRAGDSCALFFEQEVTGMNTQTHIDAMPDCGYVAQWFRRLRVAGFAFFFVKGLFWIALAVWAVV